MSCYTLFLYILRDVDDVNSSPSSLFQHSLMGHAMFLRPTPSHTDLTLPRCKLSRSSPAPLAMEKLKEMLHDDTQDGRQIWCEVRLVGSAEEAHHCAETTIHPSRWMARMGIWVLRMHIRIRRMDRTAPKLGDVANEDVAAPTLGVGRKKVAQASKGVAVRPNWELQFEHRRPICGIRQVVVLLQMEPFCKGGQVS